MSASPYASSASPPTTAPSSLAASTERVPAEGGPSGLSDAVEEISSSMQRHISQLQELRSGTGRGAAAAVAAPAAGSPPTAETAATAAATARESAVAALKAELAAELAAAAEWVPPPELLAAAEAPALAPAPAPGGADGGRVEVEGEVEAEVIKRY